MDRHFNVALAFLTIVFFSALAGCDSAQAKLRKQGISEYDAGQYDASFKTFNDALNKGPFEPTDNYYAGASALKLGKLKTAEYYLKLAWQKDPSMGDAKDALTECLLRENDEDQALNFVERDAALTAKVKDPRALRMINNRPYTHQIDEDMFLNKALDRLRVARAYERIGDMENAPLNYKKAIELAPKDPEVHFAAGLFYERFKKIQEAATEFITTYQLDPDYPEIVPALARVGLQPTSTK